jgi:hypothetical protein
MLSQLFGLDDAMVHGAIQKFPEYLCILQSPAGMTKCCQMVLNTFVSQYLKQLLARQLCFVYIHSFPLLCVS